MVIKGFQPLTLIDFPGKLAATVFTPGCNFRCPFCYNPTLVRDDVSLPLIPEEAVFGHLEKRRGLLEGLVVTGGEPTLQEDLPEFLRKVKSLGYAVKLDSNGSHPEVIKKLLAENLVDYLALDVKTSLDKAYGRIVGGAGEGILAPVKESLAILLSGAVAGELRTTVVPHFHPLSVLAKLARQINFIAKKASLRRGWRWYLQSFQSGRCLDKNLNRERSYTEQEQQKIFSSLSTIIPQVSWRY